MELINGKGKMKKMKLRGNLSVRKVRNILIFMGFDLIMTC